MGDENQKSMRGFAAMEPEKLRAIKAKGGASVAPEKRSFSQDRELAARAGRIGGKASGGNFKANPQRAAEAGRKGGRVGGGNFARNPERAREAGRKGGAANALRHGPKEGA